MNRKWKTKEREKKCDYTCLWKINIFRWGLYIINLH